LRKTLLLLLLGAMLLGLGACSKSELCESCVDDDDCEGSLNCAQFEDGSWLCVDSPWRECSTKSHLTAP